MEKAPNSTFSKGLFVCTQTFSGLLHSGIFYSWGALVDSINLQLNPHYTDDFVQDHGLFVGILILFMSVSLMVPLRLLIESKVITEYCIQLIGLILAVFGLCMISVALKVRLVWLLYAFGAIPCGVGGAGIYQRLIFNHQFYFKSIGYHNIGSGIFGFAIGMWTTVFFLLSRPLLMAMKVEYVLFLYAGLLGISVAFPLLTIDDAANNASVYRVDVSSYTKQITVTNLSCDETKDSVGDAFSNGDRKVKEKEEGMTDPGAHYELQYVEILQTPQTYMLIAFFTCVITPGWGIKLASYNMFQTFFNLSVDAAVSATALYVTFYALGRLLSGLLAEYIGVFRTYDLMILTSLALLVALPYTAVQLPHKEDQMQHSPAYAGFLTLLCLVGLMYGGAIALFYSIIFDVFGARNYRKAFSVTVIGFGFSVVVGGISSGYSFNQPENGSTPSSSSSDITLASRWFFAMAGACALGLILLHSLWPYKYPVDTATRERIELQSGESGIDMAVV